MLELFLLYCNVLQKVELQKADAAWKRTAEVSMKQTEEEKETQVTRYHSAWLSSCTVKLLHLLSLRFLKECLEPPEDLLLPGAIGLVRKTGGDATGPMSGGFPRDPRENRHTGREKRVCCVSVCIYACTCVRVCLFACQHKHLYMWPC